MPAVTKIDPIAAMSSMNFPAALLQFEADKLVVKAPAAGGPSSLVLTGDPGAGAGGTPRRIQVRQVFLNFSAAPPTGTALTITDATGGLVFQAFIGQANPGPFTFDPPLAQPTPGANLTVAVSDPGAAIGSTLYVVAYCHN